MKPRFGFAPHQPFLFEHAEATAGPACATPRAVHPSAISCTATIRPATRRSGSISRICKEHGFEPGPWFRRPASPSAWAGGQCQAVAAMPRRACPPAPRRAPGRSRPAGRPGIASPRQATCPSGRTSTERLFIQPRDRRDIVEPLQPHRHTPGSPHARRQRLRVRRRESQQHEAAPEQVERGPAVGHPGMGCPGAGPCRLLVGDRAHPPAARRPAPRWTIRHSCSRDGCPSTPIPRTARA